MRRGKLLVMAAVLSGTVFCLSIAGLHTVYAMEGWKAENGNWKYLDPNGRPVTAAWKESDGAWYYLGADGWLVKNGLIDTEAAIFYADQDGRRVENRWVLVTGGSPEQNEKAWYYFGSGGRAYMGTSGVKRQIDGKFYVFDDKGRLQTGWLDEAGKPLSEDSSPILKGVFYAGEDGALWKNEWMNYSSMPGSWWDRLESGIDGINYSEYKALWIYFDNNCRRVKAAPDENRQKVIQDTAYGFDENGVMLAWWSRPSVKGAETKVPQEPVKFYSAYNGGKLLKNSWIWMYPSEEMDQKDFENEEYSWWHTDDNGRVYRDRIKKLHGKFYAFDKAGKMQTGFVLYQGRKNFTAQYGLDAWTSEQFKYGEVLGIESSDLYLFSPNELNDGSMQMGNNLKVELSDGVYSFGFGTDGVAYGNGNALQKVKNYYYINGLMLKADENYGYGAVKAGEEDYRIVDNNGKVIKGDRRILRDRDGGWLLLLNDQFMARVNDEDKPRWCAGAEGPGFYHYDRNQRNKCGELITQYGSAPDIGGLPAEERVYIPS